MAAPQVALKSLSIIIPNFNYAHFLGDAIESALAVDWPHVEIILVDDGSTDDSLAVAQRYSDSIRILTQENSGPRIACNRGFAVSKGDIVIFLDSDDTLEPSIGREISAAFKPGVSKVQFQMRRINASGTQIGPDFPSFRRTPTPELVRLWMRSTSSYPTPPGSGNAYARWFIEQIFPLDDRCGDATDSACLAAAPFFGDVVTVPKPTVNYRQHGSNRSYLLADPTRFSRQLERALQRHRYSQSVDRTSPAPSDLPIFRSRHLLQLRVSELRLLPKAPTLPGDSRRRMAADSFLNVLSPGPEPFLSRITIAAWSFLTLLSPRALARMLIQVRFQQRG